MFTSPEQFTAANKASVESLLALANTALASAERIATLNLETFKEGVKEGVTMPKALLGAKDPQEALAIQASLAQPNVEKAVAYSRSAYEIAAKSQQEIAKLLEGQYSDFQKQVAALIDNAAKNAPAGSEGAVAAVKSAIAAATSAFDSMKTSAKQFTEAAEANVLAATDATVKAVSATAVKGKKKAA